MKTSSFKALGCLFTMGIMLSSAGAFAHPHNDKHDCFHHHKVETIKDQVLVDLHSIDDSLIQILTVLGGATDPNPGTNADVAATINLSLGVADAAIADYIIELRKLCAKESLLTLIADEHSSLNSAIVDYAVAMNRNNAGQIGGNEFALAADVISQAIDLGHSFAKIAKNQDIASLISYNAQLQIDYAQASRGVLNTDNPWGAIPGNVASQVAAAIAIRDAININTTEIGKKLVHGVADQCLCDKD